MQGERRVHHIWERSARIASPVMVMSGATRLHASVCFSNRVDILSNIKKTEKKEKI